MITGTGCQPNSQPQEAYPAVTSLEPPVSADTQKQAEQAVSQFVAAVQQKDYKQVKSLMSPTLRAQAPPTLAKWLQEGMYIPFDGATNLQYSSVEHTSRGKKLVVHTRFTSADGNPYRTNVIFTQVDNAWQIDKILPPTKPTKPVSSGMQPTKAPGT